MTESSDDMRARLESDTTRVTDRGMMRLENWRRWVVGGAIGMVLAHYYKPKAAVVGEYSRHSDDVGDGYSHEDQDTVDEIDAGLVEDALNTMPSHLCHAVRFYFTGSVPVNCIYRLDRKPRDEIKALVMQAARRLG